MKITFEYICPKTNETLVVDPNFAVDLEYDLDYDYNCGSINANAVIYVNCIKCGEQHKQVVANSYKNV